MNRAFAARFGPALAALLAESALLHAANAFGDFTQPGAAIHFVALMLAAGACFLAALKCTYGRSLSADNTTSVFSRRAALWSAAVPRSFARVMLASLLCPRFSRKITRLFGQRAPGKAAGHRSTPKRCAPVAPTRGGPLFLLILGTLLPRLIMLACPPGDDLWRYPWEGRIQLHGFNPYALSPDAPELVGLRDATWPLINHPDFAAIYPPLAELFFKAIAAVSATPLAFKGVFVLADLLTVFLLTRLCGKNAPAGVAWYAWNPAVIYAFAGGAHYDSLMVLTMTAALLVLHRATEDSRRTASWTAALLSCGLLGVSIAFKLIPIFVVPAWACALGFKRGGALALSAAIPLGLTWAFGGPGVVLEPLRYFADIGRFNDALWWLVEALTFPHAHNTLFTLVLGMTALAATLHLRHDWRRAALWSLGCALLLSPVLHPWYATWILPLACWRRVHAWSIFSLSAVSILLLWETTRFWTEWEPNILTRLLFFIPPLLAWRFQPKRLHPPPAPGNAFTHPQSAIRNPQFP